MIKHVAIFLFLSLSIVVRATAYTPAEVPDPKQLGQGYYVSNPDEIISDSDVVWLNRCAAALERHTRAEMCVVALASIGDSDAFDFSYELFQRWGIGRKGQNTGILVLFVLDSRDIRIMTGTGIEGVLTDARCSQIIHDNMVPAFRQGDYGGGLCLGALKIYETCTNGDAPEELRNARSVTNRGNYAGEDEEEWTLDDWIALAVLIIIIAFIIWVGKKGGSGGSGGYTSSGRTYRSYGSSRSSGGSWGGGSTMGGGAGGKW